jgi:hypothetical protein
MFIIWFSYNCGMYGFVSLEANKRCIAYLKEFNFVLKYHASTITKQLMHRPGKHIYNILWQYKVSD